MTAEDYKMEIKASMDDGTKAWGRVITRAQEDENINFLDFRNIVEFAYLYSNKNRRN